MSNTIWVNDTPLESEKQQKWQNQIKEQHGAVTLLRSFTCIHKKHTTPEKQNTYKSACDNCGYATGSTLVSQRLHTAPLFDNKK